MEKDNKKSFSVLTSFRESFLSESGGEAQHWNLCKSNEELFLIVSSVRAASGHTMEQLSALASRFYLRRDFAVHYSKICCSCCCWWMGWCIEKTSSKSLLTIACYQLNKKVELRCEHPYREFGTQTTFKRFPTPRQIEWGWKTMNLKGESCFHSAAHGSIIISNRLKMSRIRSCRVWHLISIEWTCHHVLPVVDVVRIRLIFFQLQCVGWWQKKQKTQKTKNKECDYGFSPIFT